jgi:spermidine synthase
MNFSFFPRTVYVNKSKISGEIVVKEHFGDYKLYVDGVIQSGGIVKDIWTKPLNFISHLPSTINHQSLVIGHCLVLGLGGGTAVHLAKQHWPKVKITAVELDPEIIKVGGKFFGLSRFKDLKTVRADAVKWVSYLNNIYHLSKFELVIVDMYLGNKINKDVISGRFLENLKKIIAPKGIVVFNWLKNRKSQGFRRRLEKIFPWVKTVDTHSNEFFLASKS